MAPAEVWRPGRAARAPHAPPAAVPLAMVAPTVVLLIGLFGVPFCALFYYALRDYDLTGRSSFVGLDNFVRLFGEPRFQHGLLVTAVYVAGVLVLSLPVAYVAALLVVRPGRGTTVLRTVLLIPWVLAPVVTALLFRTLVDPGQGPVSHLVAAVVGHQVFLPSSVPGATAVVVIHAAWRSFPLEMLVLAAAMSAVRHEQYEAVRVDGGSAWHEFRHVTLPATRPARIAASVMVGVFTVQDAESLYALTQGGPGYGTEATAVRLYRDAFVYFDVGGGSAVGVVLVALTLVVLALLFALGRRDVTA